MRETIFDLVQTCLIIVLAWLVWRDSKLYIKLSERLWTLELKDQEEAKEKPNANAEIFRNSDNLFTSKKNYE